MKQVTHTKRMHPIWGNPNFNKAQIDFNNTQIDFNKTQIHFNKAQNESLSFEALDFNQRPGVWEVSG